MYMNLKPNQHKRISFNTTTMTSLEFIAPPPPPPLFNLAPRKFNFLLRSPELFWSEIFRSPLKIGKGGGCCFPLFHQYSIKLFIFLNLEHFPVAKNLFLLIWYSGSKTRKYLILLIFNAKSSLFQDLQ